MRHTLLLWVTAPLSLTCNTEVRVPLPYPFLQLSVPPTGTQFEQVELRLDLAKRYANPFDPDEVAVSAELRGPRGEALVVPGFWFQDYVRDDAPRPEHLTARGTPGFRVRFTPTTPGRWEVTVSLSDTSLGVAQAPTQVLDVRPASKPGFIRRSAESPRHFAFDDGTPFFGIGENVAWGDLDFYERVFARLAASGGNFARVWLLEGRFDLEWTYGLGVYDQERAWRLDRLFELAERHGIYLMLCLDNHGKFSTYVNGSYATNPYNARRGGPLPSHDPSAVWTDPEAIAQKKKLYRYLIARYGHSTALHSWELWNEMDWVGTHRQDFAAHQADAARWHAEMAAFLREHDPYQHLVTTSLADTLAYTDALWRDMDFVQAHSYPRARPQAPDIAEHTFALFDKLSQRFPDKPLWLSELGIAPDDVAQETFDPEGDMLHEAVWSSLFANAAGATLPWWWDSYVDANDLYARLAGLAAFVSSERPARAAYASFHVPTTARRANVRARVLASEGYLWGWLQDLRALHGRRRGTPEPIVGAQLALHGLSDGNWRVEWWSPSVGTLLERTEATVQGGALTVRAPTFTRDVALKVLAVHPRPETPRASQTASAPHAEAPLPPR